MHRSSRHHALIKHVDTSEAAAVPGVVRVLTHEDVPNNWYTILCLIGVQPNDEPVLAEDRVLFRGEQICAVLAETEAAAIEAASKVKVAYDDLEPVFDVEEALAPDSIKIKPHGKNYFVYDDAAQPGGSGDGHHCRRVRFGDVETAFLEADHVFEHCYSSAPIEHAPTEMTGCIVVPDSDGRLHHPHRHTGVLLHARQHGTDHGRTVPKIACHRWHGWRWIWRQGRRHHGAHRLHCGEAHRPPREVRVQPAEEMQVSSPRAAERIIIKDGVNDDGKIIARQVTLYVDAGAYSRHSPYGTTKAAAHMPGPYNIPNVWVDAHCVYTNRTPSSAMRGFGVTIADFALESQMDRVAKELGIDPMEFRLINAYRDGDTKAHRQVVDDAALIEVIQKTAEITGHDLGAAFVTMSSTSNNGDTSDGTTSWNGNGVVNYPTGMNLGGDPSQALIHSTTTGTFVITLSSVDLGQGIKTIARQIAAETLGLPAENVIVDTADTDTGPHCMGTFASRGTHRIGNAVKMAATEAREVMLEVAAEELEVDADDLETDGTGFIKLKGSDDKKIHIVDLALAAHFKQGKTIAGRGIFLKPMSIPVSETGEMDPASCHAHACTVAEVVVDDETGIVEVTKLTSTYEVGRAMNPAMARQQIEGGAWMGISHALYETTEPYYPSREHGPKSFASYLMPGPADVAEMESVIIERPSRQRTVRSERDRRDDGQLPDPGDCQRHPRRLRREARVDAVHAGTILRGLDELRPA